MLSNFLKFLIENNYLKLHLYHEESIKITKLY